MDSYLSPPASEVTTAFRRLLSSLARTCLLNLDTCALNFAYIGKVVCDYEVQADPTLAPKVAGLPESSELGNGDPFFVPRPSLASIGQSFVNEYSHSLEHCDPEEVAAGMRAVEALDHGNEVELDNWAFKCWAAFPPEIEVELQAVTGEQLEAKLQAAAATNAQLEAKLQAVIARAEGARTEADAEDTSAVYCRIGVDCESSSYALVVETSDLPSGSLLTDAATAATLVQQANMRIAATPGQHPEQSLPVICCIDHDAKRVFGYFYDCCGDDTARVIEDLQILNPGLDVVLLGTDSDTAKVLLAQNTKPRAYNFKAIFWGAAAVPGKLVLA
ncbi:MAG: hypothetical protein ACYCOU_02835 [Sulfobacillus sp.]